MPISLRSFRPPFAATRARVLAGAIVSSLVTAVACLDDSPTAPAHSSVALRINAQVGGGGDDWTVAIRVYYWTRGEDQVELPTDPPTVQVERDVTIDQPVNVDIMPCLADPDRADFESDERPLGCRLYVELRLLDESGNMLSTDTQNALASVPGETVEVPEFTLPPGEIMASQNDLQFTAPDNGPVPGPIEVGLTSSTTEPLGTLSASVAYTSGSNWLSTTLNQSEGVVLIVGPSTTALAPGTYDAVVTVTSARGFVPTEISVRYVVTNRPKRVTITGAGNGSGDVTLNELDASCTIVAGQVTGTCNPLVPHGSALRLEAGANEGSSFTGWSGACTGTGPCILTMDQDRSVTATFTQLPKRLTVIMAGTGNGTVSSTPNESIACSKVGTQITGQCTFLFTHGSQITLTTFAPTGSTFAGWSGACTGTTGCNLTMDQDRTVTATFNLIPQLLTVSRAGNGTGTVTSAPPGVSCTLSATVASGACVVGFNHGTAVLLTATPASGMTFVGWGGACLASTTNQCTVTMNNSVNVTAIFDRTIHRLTIVGAGSGTGLVDSNDELINCTIIGGQTSGDCFQDYPAGTPVSLTASPAAGHSFDGWTGTAGCSETRTCVVTLNQATTVTARFLGPPPPGRDIVVFNDLNVFDDTRMANPNNVQLVRNLVNFSVTGPRNDGKVVQLECGRQERAWCNDLGNPINVFKGTIQEAGFAIRQTASLAGTLTSIASDVKLLILFMPCQPFTVTEVNALKLFASEGGRLMYVGENTGAYFNCFSVENQLLKNLGAVMTNTGSAVDCGDVLLPASSLRSHQITTGLTGLRIACSSVITLGPNDFALYYNSTNASVCPASRA